MGLGLAGCASVPSDSVAPQDPNDPFEPINRRTFEASLTTDRYFTLPVARAYRYMVPERVRTGCAMC